MNVESSPYPDGKMTNEQEELLRWEEAIQEPFESVNERLDFYKRVQTDVNNKITRGDINGEDPDIARFVARLNCATKGSYHRVSLPLCERSCNAGDGQQRYTYIIPLGQNILEEMHLPKSLDIPDVGTLTAKKDEFHVTLIGFAQARIIQNFLENKSPEEQKNIVEQINTLLTQTDFTCTVYPETFLVQNKTYDADAVRKEEGPMANESEYTIIVNVSMPGMEEFYRSMRDTIGINIGEPSTHITLYIKKNKDATGTDVTGKGIDLNAGLNVDIKYVDIPDR